MFAEKVTAVGLLVASLATTATSLAQQDWVAISGAFTVLGLAALNLYQKFREEKRKQDAADLALYATSTKARLEVLETQNADLKAQVTISKSEADGWRKLYAARTVSEHGP